MRGRRLTETGDKMKIEASVLLGDEDEEVEVHGKPLAIRLDNALS